jgi:hypothetical protein
VAGLTPEQRRVLGTIVRVANRRGIGPKLRLAAVETGLVESNLRNLAYGDGSSVGWRQETSSSYPNVNRRNVAASVNRFFNEALPLRGKYATAGALAQAVQRSAYPERYQAVRGQARQLLRGAVAWRRWRRFCGRWARVAASTTTRDAGPQGSALALLQALTQQPQQPQSAGLQAPAFSASPALPKRVPARCGWRRWGAASGHLGAAGGDPDERGHGLEPHDDGCGRRWRWRWRFAGTGGDGGPMGRGGYAYPLARRGKIIGTPYTGTHTLGNWQSDNAVDIAVPVGTRGPVDPWRPRGEGRASPAGRVAVRGRSGDDSGSGRRRVLHAPV